MLPFHKSPLTGEELHTVAEVLSRGCLAGDGAYGAACEAELKRLTGAQAALLTPSGTAALELAALLLGIGPGDEIILPSFTFPSTANAFVLRGATPVFVDIRPADMNLDTALIEAAVTPATRAVVPMHYGGMACDMDAILAVAARHGLAVIEDAALGLLAAYRERPLGAIGGIGCLSFHDSKHFSMGEGGALLLNDISLLERAEIIRQKGADIDRFRRGEVEQYCWQSVGSSYVPSELNAACLLPQLRCAERSVNQLRQLWAGYQRAFTPLVAAGWVETPRPAAYARHNGHIYYLKAADRAARDDLAHYLAAHGIAAASHYQPLHTAPAGQRYGRFAGEDRYTSRDSARLLRLPLWRGMSGQDVATVATAVTAYYGGREATHG